MHVKGCGVPVKGVVACEGCGVPVKGMVCL